MIDNPTTAQAILAFILSVGFVAVIIVAVAELLMDCWRTRKGHVLNEVFLKPRQNNYEVKFVTQNNYKR